MFTSVIDFSTIAPWADAVGPDSNLLLDWSTGDIVYPSAYVEEAHKHGLGVHPWTMRDDKHLYTKNPITDYKLFADWGVDYLFTEFPHTSVSSFELYPKKVTGVTQ